ncbi:aldehyde dehydrogenase [Planomicrobium okeanokoites]|uniref:Aldehyde dehydrogenase n=1 Tax=Planomicrobium okeanokoites TaxID=244 RepID=A0ABV7KS42_PLAOK|nr:aldehyde dehydrogenase [Planomicrobium okeanokoites]TAA70069.1 aldehyde dehydrogenase [Planomicrobium okeanokoites]
MKKIEQFINGDPFVSDSGKYFSVINPSTKEIIAEVAEGNETDVNKAVEAATLAFQTSDWAVNKDLRYRVLNRFAAILRESLPELVELESMMTGRPIREMKAQLSRLPEWYEYYASVLKTLDDFSPPFGEGFVNYTTRIPLGVVALVAPWNHPLLILTKKLAPALAAGNAVVIKPSENTPLTTYFLAELAKEAGVPNGILNVVQGYGNVVGKALISHKAIEKIDLTGGTETGRQVAAIAGSNLAKVSAELGGKASVLILPDVDLDEAVNGAAFASFIAAGQTCVQGSRILVPASLHDEFVERFIKKVEGLVIGDPKNVETDIGPVISEKQYNQILNYIQIGIDEGAKLAYGGGAPADEKTPPGFYITPTIFTQADNSMRIAQEEIFGPVTCIIKYNDIEDDLIPLANGTEMGLAMSIWTNNIRDAHWLANQLEAGIIWINDHHRIDPSSPWGGFKDSGIGSENSIQCYKDYTKIRNVIVNTSRTAFDWFDGSGQVKRYS